MIERSAVEAAVQECSQSVDETMYVDKQTFLPVEVLLSAYFALFYWDNNYWSLFLQWSFFSVFLF